MSKIYIKEVTCCNVCPCNHEYGDRTKWHKCDFNSNLIYDLSIIPDWCPLEDVIKNIKEDI